MIGLDYRTLRDELQAGSRLPSPTYGTPKMSHLIQTCWLADPIERPSFTKIKSQLQQSLDVSASAADRKNNDYLKILSDNSLYNQFKMIQESNPMFKKEERDYQNTDAHSNEQESPEDPTLSVSYPYFEISRSEMTTYTYASSTPMAQNNAFNNDVPKNLTAQCLKAVEVSPILRNSKLNHNAKNYEDSSSQVGRFQQNDPIRIIKKTPSWEDTQEETESSL